MMHFGMRMMLVIVVFPNYNLITSAKMMPALQWKLF